MSIKSLQFFPLKYLDFICGHFFTRIGKFTAKLPINLLNDQLTKPNKIINWNISGWGELVLMWSLNGC